MKTYSIKYFTITVIGANEGYTDQIYANGNQQCSVAINVQKQVYDDSTGSYTTVPLSQSEKNSITVCMYSSDINAPLPSGWSCDTSKNQYDSGLRGQGYSASLRSLNDGEASSRTQTWDSITRYIRCGTSVTPLQNYQFMARITLDNGKTYTTHYDDGNVSFESKITICPQRPYAIRVSELAARRDDPYNYEYAKGKYVDVDVYYWTLPNNLKIMSDYFSGQGYATPKLVWAYAKNDSNFFMGMAMHHDVTSLTLGDIGHLPSNVDPATNINISVGANMMRGVRYLRTDTSSGLYDNLLHWSITDNLGCVSRFVLKSNPSDSGNTLLLEQA